MTGDVLSQVISDSEVKTNIHTKNLMAGCFGFYNRVTVWGLTVTFPHFVWTVCRIFKILIFCTDLVRKTCNTYNCAQLADTKSEYGNILEISFLSVHLLIKVVER